MAQSRHVYPVSFLFDLFLADPQGAENVYNLPQELHDPEAGARWHGRLDRSSGTRGLRIRSHDKEVTSDRQAQPMHSQSVQQYSYNPASSNTALCKNVENTSNNHTVRLVPVDASWLCGHPLNDSGKDSVDKPLEPVSLHKSFREALSGSLQPEKDARTSKKDSSAAQPQSSNFDSSFAVPPPPPGFAPLPSSRPTQTSQDSLSVDSIGDAMAAARNRSILTQDLLSSHASSLTPSTADSLPMTVYKSNSLSSSWPSTSTSLPASTKASSGSSFTANSFSKGLIAKGPDHQSAFSSRMKYAERHISSREIPMTFTSAPRVNSAHSASSSDSAQANAKRASEIDRLFANDSSTQALPKAIHAAAAPSTGTAALAAFGYSTPSYCPENSSFGLDRKDANSRTTHHRLEPSEPLKLGENQVMRIDHSPMDPITAGDSVDAASNVYRSTSEYQAQVSSNASSADDSLVQWFIALGNNEAAKEVVVSKKGVAAADDSDCVENDHVARDTDSADESKKADKMTALRAGQMDVGPESSQHSDRNDHDLAPSVLSYFTNIQTQIASKAALAKSSSFADRLQSESGDHTLPSKSRQDQTINIHPSPSAPADLLQSLVSEKQEERTGLVCEEVTDSRNGKEKPAGTRFSSVEEFFSLFKSAQSGGKSSSQVQVVDM